VAQEEGGLKPSRSNMTETDNIAWLMNWYLAQCNEEWEHVYGVRIDMLDNPGWSLTIDLDETPLKGKPFDPIFENVSEAQVELGLDGDVHWMVAKVENDWFKAYGGPRDLGRLIDAFRAWVTEASSPKT
jgi:hypothetical protein